VTAGGSFRYIDSSMNKSRRVSQNKHRKTKKKLAERRKAERAK
jgi:hypothetical protein